MIDKNRIRVIVEEAFEIAKQTAEEADAKLPPERERGFDCGFAWVVCQPGNGALANVLKEYGADKHYEGGVSLWNPSKIGTQSIGPKEVGAAAFVNHIKEHLKQEGYSTLYYASRYD